jgi:hypothetical protein
MYLEDSSFGTGLGAEVVDFFPILLFTILGLVLASNLRSPVNSLSYLKWEKSLSILHCLQVGEGG